MRPLPFRLRDITPHGLYPRTLLIAILPVILLLIAVTYVFYDSHWRQTSRKLSQGMASDIAYIVAEYETQPETLGAIRQRASDLMRLEIEFRYDAALPTEQKRTFFTPLDDILTQELSVRIDKPFWFDISGFEGAVIIEVALGEDVMRFIAQRDRTFSTTGHIFIVWVIGATILLILLAVGFLRNQIRSILRLTEAAKAFGRGQDAPDYRPSGATEIREAARAVLDMKARLTSFAQQRTAMLAGVSHDLRTPL
ncbi:MAG: HAMP domain-containing protein, partial [Hyphomonadaceae bacterium]